MISPQCFTKEWVAAKSREIGAGQQFLVEKTIHAFALLGHLAKKDAPLVFKGGTSLLLRLPRFRRLSIDIDVMCPLPDAELDRMLAEVAMVAPFERYEEDDQPKGSTAGPSGLLMSTLTRFCTLGCRDREHFVVTRLFQ